MKNKLSNQKNSNRKTVISFVLRVCYLLSICLVISSSVIASERNNNPKISDVKIDNINNKLYFRWVANNISHDGFFVVQKLEQSSFRSFGYKTAIGVPINEAIFYSLTASSAGAEEATFRIKYISIKGDSAFSSPVDVRTVGNFVASKSEPDYLKVKVLSDTLYDEAGLCFIDKTSDNIIKPARKNFFEGDSKPYIFFKSEQSNPLCLTSVAFNADKHVVPMYLKHNTGGLYVLSFQKQIAEPSVNVYLENVKTKELTQINHNDSIVVYLKDSNDGQLPAFNLIFTKETESGQINSLPATMPSRFDPLFESPAYRGGSPRCF
jgi:hypothetical protein